MKLVHLLVSDLTQRVRPRVLCTGSTEKHFRRLWGKALQLQEPEFSHDPSNITCRRCKELHVENALTAPSFDTLLADEVGKPIDDAMKQRIAEKATAWLKVKF